MSPHRAKRAAAQGGFEFWYDRELRLWTLSREGYQTEYLAPRMLADMSPDKFIEVFILGAVKND